MESPQTPVILLDDTPVLSTVQVARFSGATYRQLDFWARIGALVPTIDGNGSGSQRRYSQHEARVAWAYVQAKRAQGTTGAQSAVHRVIGDALRALPSDQWGGVLLTNGTDTLIVEHALALLDAMNALGPAVVVIDLDACPELEP